MLIHPNGLHLSIRTPIALTRAQTQELVDAEVRFADLGLEMSLWCLVCRKTGDDFVCHGGHTGGTFSVDCACRHRTYTGDDITVPSPPRRITPRRTSPGDDTKPAIPLSGSTVQAIKTFEQVCDQLRLQYVLRCQRCRLDDRNDGVWGVGESGASTFVVECACTKRVYVGADAPAPIH